MTPTNVLTSVVGWLPVKYQPYAKTIAAAVLALLTILSVTVDGLPTWVTIAAAVLTAPVVFATTNLDPAAQKQDESVMPPTETTPSETEAPNAIYGQGVEEAGTAWSVVRLPADSPRPFVAAFSRPITPEQLVRYVGTPVKRPSRKGRVFIVAALALLGVVELIGVFGDADTISGLTADVFHTSTPVGRAIFVTAWVVFAGWFGFHIWFWGRSTKRAHSL